MNIFILPVVSAAFFVLSFPNFNINFLGWFFLVPLLAVTERTKDSSHHFLAGYLFGVVFFLSSIYWIIHVTLVGYIGVCFYLALYYGIFVYLTGKIANKGRSIIFWAPCIWTALEFLREIIITGFPWALAGATQISYLQMIQVASMTGVWGVSFVVVLINVFVYENLYLGVVKNQGMKNIFASIMAVIVVGYVVFYGMQELKKADKAKGDIPFKVSIVQPGIQQELKWDRKYRDFIYGRFRYLTMSLKKEKPELVIWPESCMPGEIKYDKYIYNFTMGLSAYLNAPILLGNQDIEFGKEKKFYNSAILIHPKYKFIGQYNKLHLVPFGEYVPLSKYFPFLRKLTPIEADFSPGNEFTTLGVPQLLMKWTGDKGEIRGYTRIIRFGTVICFEDIFPNLVRRFAKHHVDFLVNLTNDAWFKNTPAPFQHACLSAFRAVENRVYFLRCTNTGYSCVIDPYGRVVADIKDESGRSLFVPGTLTYEFNTAPRLTLYTQFGDWFPIFCIVISLIGVFLALRQKEKNI